MIPPYIKYGLTNGAVSRTVEADGSITYNRDRSLIKDNNLASAMAAKKTTCGYYSKGFVPALNKLMSPPSGAWLNGIIIITQVI